MLGEREDARDAAQEALLQAFQNLARFEPERSFIKWLLGIGAKRCLDHLRRRRNFLKYIRDFTRERGGPPHREPSGPAAAPVLDEPGAGRLLQKLSPRERAVVSLAVFEDFSAREIAMALGCSENTARVHLFNTRVKLKKEVADGL